MNVLIISNLILFLILLGVYLYAKNSILKSLFYNVLLLDILIYFIFPTIVSILNIILYVILNLNSIFLIIVLIPLIIPIYKIIFNIVKFIEDYKLYSTYENKIYFKLIELLISMDIHVDKDNITLDLRKSKSVIYCDVYIKIVDIGEKTKKKDELKSKLTDTFKNIIFNIIFDIKFNYKKI